MLFKRAFVTRFAPDACRWAARSRHGEALNRKGKPIKIKAKGWLARIFQHEIDHLDGVLFIDKASKVWKLKEGETVAEEMEV